MLNGQELNSRLDELVELTECNLHNEAYVAGCDLLIDCGCHVEDLKSKFQKWMWKNERLGYMPNEDMQDRYKTYELMMRSAKALFGPTVYNRFYMCF